MMKRQVILYLFMAGLVFIGCKKDDGMVSKEARIERVPTPKIVKNGGSAAIDMTNLAGFSGKFDVSLLYPRDIPPSKMDVVIRKNENNGNIKVVQADLRSFPVTLTISAAQIATLFGASVALGDNYDIGLDVYAQSGKKYSAFPAVGGTGYAPGVGGQPGSSLSIRYSAICQYNSNDYQGAFLASDAFGDADGATLVLTRIDNTRFSFVYPSVLNPVPIVVVVNPLDNTTAINGPVTIGSNWSPAFGYPNTPTYVNPSVNSAVGFVSPCNRSVTLNIQWGTNAGALQFGGGPYRLVLTKI